MKSKELRIGNVIRVADGRVVSVIEITTLGIIAQPNQKKKSYSFIPYEQLGGIPLTADILYAFNFESYNDREDDFVLELFEECENGDDTLYIHAEKIKHNAHFLCFLDSDNYAHSCEYAYVHQLQNLHYAITQTELLVSRVLKLLL